MLVHASHGCELALIPRDFLCNLNHLVLDVLYFAVFVILLAKASVL